MSEQRPGIWVGHVALKTAKLEESEACMQAIGLRPIFRGDTVAVLELRGGTHLVLELDKDAGGTDADFDYMVEDLDLTHADFKGRGFDVSEIRRGRIHDDFTLVEPGGNRIVVNSTHVKDHDAV